MSIILQATEDVQEGITDEDYDLFYEIWQEFDPDGTQYMSYKNLLEFVDVLEPPLQICKPNKFKIIHMDIPIVRWTDPGSGEIKENMVFCTDILDALTQDFFARKGNPIDEPPHVDEIKVNLQLIYFQNYAFLYHFIKEFEEKNAITHSTYTYHFTYLVQPCNRRLSGGTCPLA